MRVLMLEARAGEQHAALRKGFNHSLVGVTLFTLVGDDALAGETRRLLGECAVGIDRVGNDRTDAARFEFAGICGPDVEVFAAMTGCRVNETRAGVVGDVVACQ